MISELKGADLSSLRMVIAGYTDSVGSMEILLGYKNPDRTKFIIKIFPRLFDRRVRLSTVLTLMAYNEFAYTV